MTSWLMRLLCDHEYKAHETKVYAKGVEVPDGRRVVLVCKKCGQIRKVRL